MMPSQDQLNDVAKQKARDGSAAWNAAGHFGIDKSGIAVPLWVTEGITSSHGTAVTNRVKDISTPEGIYQTSLVGSNIALDYGTTYNGRRYSAEEFIVEKGIKILTRSIGGPANSGQAESYFWNNLKAKYNLAFFNSAGNEGWEDDLDSLDCSFPSDVALYITGMTLNGVASYSSIGEEVDFCDYVGFLSGTSFAAPYAAAKARLLKARYGIDMSQDEIMQFFIMCKKDLGALGFDIRTGHGQFIMPAVRRKYIRMTAGQTDYRVDGVKKTMDTVPVNREGTNFVPLRAVGESLGKTVTWDEVTDTATLTDGVTIVTLTLGDIYMKKNGAKIKLNFAPYRDASGRTMVPIRAIAEAYGCIVDWIQEEKRIMILEAA